MYSLDDRGQTSDAGPESRTCDLLDIRLSLIRIGSRYSTRLGHCYMQMRIVRCLSILRALCRCKIYKHSFHVLKKGVDFLAFKFPDGNAFTMLVSGIFNIYEHYRIYAWLG